MKQRISKGLVAVTLLVSGVLCAFSQSIKGNLQLIRINKQHNFPAEIPKGNYSGITYLGGNKYAVVSDKAAKSGFFVFDIQLDSLSGDIKRITNEGFFASSLPGRDDEDVAFCQQSGTLFIAGEADNAILEYDFLGQITGRKMNIPDVFGTHRPNYGLESLTYNAVTTLFWTTSESTLSSDGEAVSPVNNLPNRLRLQSFDEKLNPGKAYFYKMDPPKRQKKCRIYANGVVALAALDDGSLLVLEREAVVPKHWLGAYVANKIYVVAPSKESEIELLQPLSTSSVPLKKHLLASWQTSMTLLRHDYANYESMCLGPILPDGSRVLVLCADSQNRYRGVLKDWFRTIIIK